MSLVSSSISGAAYVLSNNDDKDTGNGFEFTRRRKWPQLVLQELVGAALFCLKPTSSSTSSDEPQRLGWKIIFASPSVNDMIGQKPHDLEGRDFLDLVYASDQSQLVTTLTSLLVPSLSTRPSETSTSTTASNPLTPLTSSSKSQTTYARMLTNGSPATSRPSSSSGQGSNGDTQTIVWEIRAHATGVEGNGDGQGGFGLGGAGTMVPQITEGDELKGKAVWVMARRVGESPAESDSNGNNGNGQSLDAFLEFKLENEKLREELRELQLDMGDFEDLPSRSYMDTTLPYHQSFPSSGSEPSSSPSSSLASSPGYTQPSKLANTSRPGRQPKTKDARDAREKKRTKRTSMSGLKTQSSRGAVTGGTEGEGHVCVTCGRTDSPEWRKGPLGPKTLCNACGLRWAKRNSSTPSRKDRKTAHDGRR